MFDIGLYGHITLDRIIDGFRETHRLGGIANSWEALTHLAPNKTVQIAPTSIGEALILVNKKMSRRTSRANMNIEVADCVPIRAAWHHVMYLNSIHDLSFLKDVIGIVSADITTGPVNNLDWLGYVDYLFISDEDLFMDLEELANLTKGWVILHDPTGSVCSNGDEKHDIFGVVDLVEDINVLGAGDIFASAFIAGDSSADIVSRIENSHIETTKLLQALGE